MNDSAGSLLSADGRLQREDVPCNGTVLVVDADNTLWDTNEVFAAAQLRLLELTEQSVGRACSRQDRLAFVRTYDQAIAVRHHLHLKYPAQLLVTAIAAGLADMDAESAAEAVVRGRLQGVLSEPLVNDVLAEYFQALAAVPALLPTVREGLELANAMYMPVVVMTEGKLDRQRKALEEHGLTPFVVNVWEMTKTTAQFERIRERFASVELVVIGDQVDRDIAPAHEAGCKTVLVPGKFQPSWSANHDGQIADHIASTFLSAIEWVAGSCIPSSASE